MHLLHHHQDAAAWVKLIALFKQCHAKHCGRISFEIRSMGSSLATSYLIITYFFCISLNSSCIACSPSIIICVMKMKAMYMIQSLCTFASFCYFGICCSVSFSCFLFHILLWNVLYFFKTDSKFNHTVLPCIHCTVIVQRIWLQQ